ncbi:MAG: spinster family MFS transporter [Erythrobacter sp.]
MADLGVPNSDTDTPPALVAPVSMAEEGWPSAGRAWWHVIVLTTAYVVSFVDRTIISLLVEPIKADLGISDTEIALLQGLAFGLCYALMGFPLGWMADRWSRRTLIGAGSTLWGVATAWCGTAGSFVHLFLARVGVGIGEASLSPAALSTISDLFPRDKRGLPIGLYTMAVSLGSGLALILGGAALAWITTLPPTPLPYFGVLAPWRMAFVAVGLGGAVLLLFLLATVREPRRRTAPLANQSASSDSIMRYMLEHRRFFGRHYAGVALYSILVSGVLSWAPTLFIRRFGWNAGEVGLYYGMLFLVFGGLGTIIGGALSSVLQRRGVKGAPVWIAGWGVALVTPFMVIAGFTDNASLALWCFAPALMFFTSPGATAVQAIQDATPGHLRGRSAAVYSFAVTIIGMTVGPLIVAFFTDAVFGDPMAIGKALALTAALCAPLSGALILWGVRPFEQTSEGL